MKARSCPYTPVQSISPCLGLKEACRIDLDLVCEADKPTRPILRADQESRNSQQGEARGLFSHDACIANLCEDSPKKYVGRNEKQNGIL